MIQTTKYFTRKLPNTMVRNITDIDINTGNKTPKNKTCLSSFLSLHISRPSVSVIWDNACQLSRIYFLRIGNDMN
jgi:hypothetical protein